MDDFGSGLSSFAYLKNLEVDYLKIDGMYTRNVQIDEVNQEMVAAMIKLARTMEFRVVAEQVERQIATPLEKILFQIDGVEYIYSMSRPEQCVVTVRFFVGEDRVESLVKI